MKDDAPAVHSVAPDATKCVRALEDALNKIAWIDDSLVTEQRVTKRYGETPGVRVVIVSYSDEEVIRGGMRAFALTD